MTVLGPSAKVRCASCGNTMAWHKKRRPRHPFSAPADGSRRRSEDHAPSSPSSSKPKIVRLKVPIIVITSERYRLVLTEYNENLNQVFIEERHTDAAGGDCWRENCRFGPSTPVTHLIEALCKAKDGQL